VDFSFSDEQQMLRDSVARYVSDHYTFEQRKGLLGAGGSLRKVWQDFADLGVLGVNVPEQHGGLGAGAIETLVVSTVMGESLVVEPYLASAVVASRAIAKLGSPAQQAEWLPELTSGTKIAVLAAGFSATSRGSEWELSGSASVVYHAPAADLFLVAAATEFDHALFFVPAQSAGVVVKPFTTIDAQPAGDIELSRVVVTKADRLGTDVTADLEAILDFGCVALCAEALGALDRCLELTVEYTRSRKQFGGPIARFQVLRHRMADMLTKIEQARSLVYAAASNVESADVCDRKRLVSAAKVLIGEAARYVGQHAVQLHGAMGMSDEASVSHYFRRLLATDIRFGSADAHLGRYTQNLQESSDVHR
jgi:alkylation response protein AidB-like acyl-CoA dehydrogenase